MDEVKFCDVLMLDLQKACDTVDHSILLIKMHGFLWADPKTLSPLT